MGGQRWWFHCRIEPLSAPTRMSATWTAPKALRGARDAGEDLLCGHGAVLDTPSSPSRRRRRRTIGSELLAEVLGERGVAAAGWSAKHRM